MGLAKTVLGKAENHLPDPIAHFRARAVQGGAGVKFLFVFSELTLLVLFADHLAQAVRRRGIEAGEGDGYFGDILLVDHNAVGILEHLLQARVQGLP